MKPFGQLLCGLPLTQSGDSTDGPSLPVRLLWVTSIRRDLSKLLLVVKNPPAHAGDLREAAAVPGQEDPMEKEMATHSSILA